MSLFIYLFIYLVLGHCRAGRAGRAGKVGRAGRAGRLCTGTENAALSEHDPSSSDIDLTLPFICSISPGRHEAACALYLQLLV